MCRSMSFSSLEKPKNLRSRLPLVPSISCKIFLCTPVPQTSLTLHTFCLPDETRYVLAVTSTECVVCELTLINYYLTLAVNRAIVTTIILSDYTAHACTNWGVQRSLSNSSAIGKCSPGSCGRRIRARILAEAEGRETDCHQKTACADQEALQTTGSRDPRTWKIENLWRSKRLVLFLYQFKPTLILFIFIYIYTTGLNHFFLTYSTLRSLSFIFGLHGWTPVWN